MQSVIHRAIFAVLAVSPAALAQPWLTNPAGWPCFGYNSLHQGQPGRASQPLNHIKWSATVDTNFTGLAHYGSPIISPANTVIFPVHTASGFSIQARRASDGTLLWSQNTGFSPQSSWWLPVCGCTLTPFNTIAVPDSGGRILLRGGIDGSFGGLASIAFYGLGNYQANPSAYDNNVRIVTPITSDAAGSLYFGFNVSGATPLNLQSGIARIGADGRPTWISAAAAAQDGSITNVALNCAPAFGFNGRVLYISLINGASGYGYLVGLDSQTLAPLYRVRMKDPKLGSDAYVIDLSTASPTVGPDGQVYYGVFDDNFNNNDRGWMLHYDAKLSKALTPGAFGWDHTASIVPVSAVPSYTGTSSYLLLTKYNNYAGIGNGDGLNKVALLDPNATEIDPVSGVTTMKEVMTVLGVTPDPGNGPNAVREWCINNAAVDVPGHSALVNSEDGNLYRWSFNTNSLTQVISLNSGAGVPYTPTVIGPDGTVYAINNALLSAVGQ
jgi:hypothetical protein